MYTVTIGTLETNPNRDYTWKPLTGRHPHVLPGIGLCVSRTDLSVYSLASRVIWSRHLYWSKTRVIIGSYTYTRSLRYGKSYQITIKANIPMGLPQPG